MLSAFVLEEGRVIQAQIDDKDDLTRKDLVWVDLAYPSEEERELVQSVFPLNCLMMRSYKTSRRAHAITKISTAYTFDQRLSKPLTMWLQS